MHLYAALVHREAFFGRNFGAGEKTLARGVGVIFDAPLRGIGTPGSVFSTKFPSGFPARRSDDIGGTLHSYVTLGEGAPRGVGVIFDAPLRGIGTPGSVFWTKIRSVF